MLRAFKFSFALVTVLFLCSCGARHEKPLAESLESLHIADLHPKDLTVTSFDQHGKDEAILVADVHTAFLMKKNSRGDWEVQSVRLGDRNWEDAKDFAAALQQVRLGRVKSDFEELANAIDKYRKQTRTLPAVQGIGPLVDLLYPAYMARAVRFDPWATEYDYRSNSGRSYTLTSAGPDRRFGTADDIRFER